MLKKSWKALAIIAGSILMALFLVFVWPIPQIVEKLFSTIPVSVEASVPTATQAPTATEWVIVVTSTQGPTQAPTERPVSTVITSAVNTPTEKLAIGKWGMKYFTGVTDQMKSWTFKDLDPKLWPVFPNVNNGSYLAADGLEYGMAESVFCQQDQRCDFEVAARHYRLFTGDYNIAGLTCKSHDGIGCAIAVFNVGNVTAFWPSQEMHDGFTVTGRYWNGDKLPQAIWALLSNTANNMLNLNSPLNQNDGTNAGANCSVPGGCVGVDVTFAITSGNEVLVTGHTVVNK